MLSQIKRLKTKTHHKEKISIVTLGCAKNLVDSEVLQTQLSANDLNAAHDDHGDGSTVIVNTCGFIESAKQESIDTILGFAEKKSSGEIRKLFVTGCLSERYKEELSNEVPQVDAWFGTGDMFRLLKQLGADYKKELVGTRKPSTLNHYAYLKIAEGCDRPCSFCAIPLMRGGHVSRPVEELVREATSLAKGGVKELLIIAQDSTYYGLDLYEKRKLADLLERLSDIEGLEWIRLHYAFPTGFPLDVLDIMAKKPNICNYLDVPLQHASSKMLQIMRRGTTREKTQELLNIIRERVPGIALRTTMVLGHPGETKEDFEELKAFIEKNRFERLGVFTYSHEENTHSHTMEDNVPERTKRKRADEIMALQQEISLSLNQKKIGEELQIIIDRKEGGYYIGRTEHDSPDIDNEVMIDASKYSCDIGGFMRCKVVDVTDYDLFCEPVK